MRSTSSAGAEVSLVEVKTRARAGHGSTLEAVDERNQRTMASAVAEYRAATGWRASLRFHLVGMSIEAVEDVLA
ncbi:MAG TPA: YraN family protein [Candidatus Dormibacteraeota bacterium]|nr:YraN family protein [Candidatus Dormibacteraeota bacterium]